jgi:hypothetical protein
VTRSILEPTSTPVDVLSPSGQTVSVSVEGVPPSTTSNAVSPLGRGRTDLAASLGRSRLLPHSLLRRER